MSIKGLQTDMDYDNRRKRKEAVKLIISCLSAIRTAEKKSLDNIPENFLNSESFEIGEYALEALDEIIDLLVDVY
jgi:hypothetical protein